MKASFTLMTSHEEINKEALRMFSLLSLYLLSWLERGQNSQYLPLFSCYY